MPPLSDDDAVKSLVHFEGEQYRLLDTVRQSAAEKLATSGEEGERRDRHARFFVALVEEAEPRIFAGAGHPTTMARLDEQIGNIRAVLDWGGEPELQLRLVYALHWYWFARGQFHEVRKRIETALERGANEDELVRARAVVAVGHAAVWQGDFTALRPRIDEAARILRPLNARETAGALMLLATAHAFAEGDHQSARELFAIAETVARKAGRVALARDGLFRRRTSNSSLFTSEPREPRYLGNLGSIPTTRCDRDTPEVPEVLRGSRGSRGTPRFPRYSEVPHGAFRERNLPKKLSLTQHPAPSTPHSPAM